MKAKLEKLLKATDNYPMQKYICKSDVSDSLIEELKPDTIRCWAYNEVRVSPIDDDTNYTVLAMKVIDDYGFDFTSDNVLEAWCKWIPVFDTFTAERVAYRNYIIGLKPPETACYRNPYREMIGAQIRGDFFGYVNVGKPKEAGELAFRDASISHIKNGIYGEMYVAALIAIAAVDDDIMFCIKKALEFIPKKSRLKRDIEKVITWYNEGVLELDVIEKIHEIFDETCSHHWCDTNSNAMIVIMALLYGNKDFGKSICLAVQAAIDTDCNGATVGSVLGIMLGIDGIDSYWTDAFSNGLCTSMEGYGKVSLDTLVDKTIEIIKKKG